jgi:kinesin family protein 6/9
MPVSSEEDAISLFFEAQTSRAVAEHQLNRRSSRSHVIYTFYVTRTISKTVGNESSVAKGKTRGYKQENDENEIIQSKLHLIDLAVNKYKFLLLLLLIALLN